MKKEIIGLILSILIIGLIAGAETDSENKINISESAKDISAGVKGGTNQILSKQIKIPENLQFPARIIFGLGSDETIDLQNFIVLAALFFILLLIIHSFLEIFLRKGWKSWIVGIVATLLISSTGAIKNAAGFFLDFGGFFGALKEWGIFKLIMALILLGILVYLLLKLIHFIKHKTAIENATMLGYRLGAEEAKLEAQGEMREKLR